MVVIKMKNVSFTYPNGFCAVEEFTLNIYKGEALAIIGQNGAGKTTSVKMLNGLLKPTVGDIFINGKNTKCFTTAQISRDVGYVFQNPDDQIFNKSVYHEVMLALKMQKIDKKEIERRVGHALEMTHIEEFKNINPFDIPLQMRKFITIASVIAMDPEVFIFDEPTAGQDINGNLVLSNIIKELVSTGKSVITISHDMDFVVRNFPRTIIMANKRKVKEGKTFEVFKDKKALEVAMLSLPPIGKLSEEIGIEDVLLPEQMVDLITKY